jgi:hypothetical protein
MTPEQAQAFDERVTAFNDELRKSGAWVSGEGLGEPSAAKTVRFADGKPSVKDGPASDKREQFGGFWIIEAPSLEDAVAWGKKAPLNSGAIEVRELV